MTPAEPDNYHDPAENFPRPRNQSADGNWNPYESTWADTGPVIMQAQTVSALAILSMISGIVSIPLICLCFFAIPFSLFAIVAGHISRSICRRSQGRVTGDGMAIAGLSLGYISLAIVIGMFVFMFAAQSRFPGGGPGIPGPGIPPQLTNETGAEETLDAAIASLSSLASTGNSDAAVKLAAHLQASLHDIAQQLQDAHSSPADEGADPSLIAENDPTAESTSVVAELPEAAGDSELQRALQEATAYCSLKSNSCAFLVGISNLSNLNETDRIVLSQMVWLAAGRSAKDQCSVGQQFAVALVDDNNLQEINLGTYQNSDQYDAGLEHRVPSYENEKRMQLELLFQPEQISSDVEPASEDANELMLKVPGE